MIVPDASVVLKWFLPEADRDKALPLVARHLSGQDVMTVPELLFYEVSNILTIKSRLPEEMIFGGMRYLYALRLRAVRLNQHQALKAIRLARSYQLSVYDASYIALASTVRATFVTADVRMARKLQGFTFVKTLDELGMP